MEELSSQIASAKAEINANIAAIQSTLGTQGIKRVLRGTTTSTSVTLSPSVDPTKCVVELNGIYTGGSGTQGTGVPAIVTSLTSTSMGIQHCLGGNFTISYQIIEYK